MSKFYHCHVTRLSGWNREGGRKGMAWHANSVY